MHSIAVAGHLCLDIVPRLGSAADLAPGRLIEVGALDIQLGGSVANTGGALADLGAEVVPFASVGGDELGSLLMDKLAVEGFATPRLSASPGSTTSYSLVIEKPDSDRTFWHHTGANADFDGTSVDVEGRTLLHLGYPPLLPAIIRQSGRPLHTLFARARVSGVTTSLDLAVVDPTSTVGRLDWRKILQLVLAETDIVSPSLDDLTSAHGIDEPYSLQLVDGLADQLLHDGAAVVAISAGQHGLRLRTATAARLRAGGHVLASIAEQWADRALTLRPVPVQNPVTTNGAGDASTAGLLYAMSMRSSPEQAMLLAAACSAVVMRGDRTSPAAVVSVEPELSSIFAASTTHAAPREES